MFKSNSKVFPAMPNGITKQMFETNEDKLGKSTNHSQSANNERIHLKH